MPLADFSLVTARARRDRNERAEQSRLRTLMWVATTATIACLVWIFYLILSPWEVIDPAAGSTVDFAKVRHPTAQRGALRDDAIIVAVTHDGKVYLGPHRINVDSLTDSLKAAIRSGAPPTVYIKSDARARYGNVEEVMDHIRTAGLSNVVFLVAEAKTVAP